MKKSLFFIPALFLWISFVLLNTTSGYSQTALNTDSAAANACMQCHGQVVEKQIKHKTETGKACADCHKPSDATHPTAKVSLEKNVPDLCLSCHKEQKDLIAGSAFVHKVVNDQRACSNCHNPHSSDVKKLLLTGKRDLCLSCHNKPMVVSANKTLSDMDKLFKTSKVQHPPFKGCANTCHNSHASNDSRLLNLAFPTNNYLPANVDSFGLCWECHDPELMTNPKTSGATSFRDGDKNLHFVHVNGAKGRSCAMCHNPHATTNLHLIRDKVGFGSWEFRMNYVPNGGGGTCLPACHSEKRYTR